MSFFKKLGKAFKGILGLDTGKDFAKKQQEQLDQLRQQQLLDANNEVENVVEFDETEVTDGFTGTTRRPKKGQKGYGNQLGLQIV